LDIGLRLHGITFAEEVNVRWFKMCVKMNGTDDEDELWEENCGENFSPSD
jgi:hypothetical protein